MPVSCINRGVSQSTLPFTIYLSGPSTKIMRSCLYSFLPSNLFHNQLKNSLLVSSPREQLLFCCFNSPAHISLSFESSPPTSTCISDPLSISISWHLSLTSSLFTPAHLPEAELISLTNPSLPLGSYRLVVILRHCCYGGGGGGVWSRWSVGQKKGKERGGGGGKREGRAVLWR